MTLRGSITTVILSALLGYELTVLVILALFPFIMEPGPVGLNDTVHEFLAPLSTVLLLGLLYSWVVRLGARRARNYSSRFNRFVRFLSEPFKKTIGSIKTTSLDDPAASLSFLSRPKITLALSLGLSIILAYISYRPDLNPSQTLVGVDSTSYVGWISAMLARPWPQALLYSFVLGLDGSRPLLLILLYLVASIGVSPSAVIEYLPMIISPLLSLSTYAFVRFGQGNAKLAGLTALLTPVSFYTTVGLWGGYYANWLGLVLAYLFMTALLIFSKTSSLRNYTMMYLLSLGLFLTHPWTWVLVVTVGVGFAITIWKETGKLLQLISMTGIITTGALLDIVKSAVFTTTTVAADIATKSPSSIEGVLGFWNNLVQALLYTNNGLMADWLVLGLSMLATFIFNYGNRFERLLLLWTVLPSIPFFILDSYNQSRIIYDLPTPTFTTFAIVILASQIKTRRQPGVVIALIFVTITNHCLQAILQL